MTEQSKEPSCRDCVFASGIRSSQDEDFTYYCCWLEHQLPPPLYDAVYGLLETGGAPICDEDGDYELTAACCRTFTPRGDLPADTDTAEEVAAP